MTNRINTENPLQTLASLRDLLPRPVLVRWPKTYICGATGTAEEIVKSSERLDALLRSFPTNLPYSLDEIPRTSLERN